MDKNLELYLEEQRQTFIDLRSDIGELKIAINNSIVKEVEITNKLDVAGEVKVNTEKEVSITNIQDFVAGLDVLSENLSKAIENNAHKPLEAVTVKNIEDAIAKEIKISNFTELKKEFNDLRIAIENNQPVVNVQKQEVVFPTSASNPVSVRLSDGKSFYTAIASAFSGGMSTSGLATTAKQDDIITAIGSIGGSIKYVTLIDETTTTNVTYIGKALPTGASISTATAAWQITRIDESASPTTIQYTNGNLLFDNTFTSLASKTYN